SWFHPSSPGGSGEFDPDGLQPQQRTRRAFAPVTGRIRGRLVDLESGGRSPPGSPVVFACAVPRDLHSRPLAEGRLPRLLVRVHTCICDEVWTIAYSAGPSTTGGNG